ncbi:MAG: A/G-specific adenine glycosylase [Clostridiales bacterium]|nr:A/G-specific adenine glycosylase [Clostridiales bacterium]
MIEKIGEPLVQWYRKDHRILPWRESKNPYYIWISEIMLQQTRVEAVKPFFERFIRELPRVEDVASCPEERLLKLWEGLGYYNRVRNIQKAAVRIVEEYGGVLPADYEKLRELPGIGNYTAGAVASIAYGIPVPAVDGNVLRVYARITESYDDILKQSVKSHVERELQKIMPTECPGDLNQALMELGATVCVPNGPAKCEICPVAKLCKARANHTVEALPVKKKPKERRLEKKTVLVIRDGERVAVRKRPSKGLLAGLYELPNLEGHLAEEQILEWVKEHQLVPLRIQPLDDAKHIFSHVEWRMKGYVVKVAALDTEKQDEMIFAEAADVEERYPVPAAFHAYASYMNMKLGVDFFREKR